MNVLALKKKFNYFGMYLYSGSISSSLIWIDGLVQHLVPENILEQFFNLGNLRRSTSEDDFVNLHWLHFSIAKAFLHEFDDFLKQVNTEILKTLSSYASAKTNTPALAQTINDNVSFCNQRQSAFRFFTSDSQTVNVRFHILIFTLK